MKYIKCVVLALLIFLASCGAVPQEKETVTEQTAAQTAARGNAQDDELLAALAAMQNYTTTAATSTQPQSFTQPTAAAMSAQWTSPPAAPATATAATTKATTTRKAWTYSVKTASKAATTARPTTSSATSTTTSTTAAPGGLDMLVQPNRSQTGTWPISTAGIKNLGLTTATRSVTTKDSAKNLEERKFVGIRLRDFLTHHGIDVNALGNNAELAVKASDGESATYYAGTIKNSDTLLAWEENGVSLAQPRMCPGGSNDAGQFLKNVNSIELKSK